MTPMRAVGNYARSIKLNKTKREREKNERISYRFQQFDKVITSAAAAATIKMNKQNLDHIINKPTKSTHAYTHSLTHIENVIQTQSRNLNLFGGQDFVLEEEKKNVFGRALKGHTDLSIEKNAIYRTIKLVNRMVFLLSALFFQICMEEARRVEARRENNTQIVK